MVSGESRMPFGMYEGEKLVNVEPAYLLVVGESEMAKKEYPELSAWVAENRKMLEEAAAARIAADWKPPREGVSGHEEQPSPFIRGSTP